MKQRISIVCICALSMVLLAGAASAKRNSVTFGLAADGKPAATIVLAGSPTQAAAFAAKELQDHVRQISGAELPIVSDDIAVTGPRILIGESAATRMLGIAEISFKSQEYAIRFLPDTLVLMGKDKAGASSGEMPGFFEDKGTLDATYDFLERFCGVRWYYPTAPGTVCPKQSTLVVKGYDVRRSPSMRYAWVTPMDFWLPKKSDYVPGPETALWKLRVRMGGQQFQANHSFLGFYDRFLKTRPEWFAKGYNGQPPQMCFTNPEFIQQVVQDARDFFDGKGLQPGAQAMGDFFGLVPMDNNQWCKCNTCQAQLNSAKTDNKEFSNGKASNYVWGFINKVAKEVRKTHPDKYVAGLAYFDYAYYPTNVDLESNVAVMLCMVDSRQAHAKGAITSPNDTNMFATWIKNAKGRPMYAWLYYCFPALSAFTDKIDAFPGFYAHTTVKQMKMLQNAGIRGVFMEHSSEFRQSHLLDVPDIYIAMRLANDASLDGNAMIDEYFNLCYGAAAAPMHKLYDEIEAVYTDPANHPKDNAISEDVFWGRLGTPERMTAWAKLMDQARSMAATDLEKQRVAYFDQGVWQPMRDGAAEHPNYVEQRKRPIPRISVAKVSPPAVPGDPTGVDWSKAAVLTGWARLSGARTDRNIQTRVLHDGEYLYVQLEEKIATASLSSTEDIFWGDDWELFFAQQRVKPYVQLSINPKGKTSENLWGTDDASWKSQSKIVSDVSDPNRWLVSISVPLASVVPGGVKPGTPFYAAFYRTVAGQGEFIAWSPTFGSSFHDQSRMGELTLQ